MNLLQLYYSPEIALSWLKTSDLLCISRGIWCTPPNDPKFV